MNEILKNSLYFGMTVSVGSYLAASWLKKKTGWAILNPLLVSSVMVLLFLVIFRVDYQTYNDGAKYLSYLLTPATVCLAIPLYKQLELLKKYFPAVIGAIFSGVAASAAGVFALAKVMGLEHEHYVTLLPKSITTAIGMGVSEEAGGIVTLTVISIIITGVLGSVIAEAVFKLIGITHPMAKGLALGTSAHAVGTSKALELGEIEGAMSSLSIAVAGLMTVILVPLISGLL